MSLHAWQYLVEKFHQNQNVLYTLDLIQDIHLAAEYRRLLSSDLPRKGYKVEVTKVGPKCWKYRLLPSQPELVAA